MTPPRVVWLSLRDQDRARVNRYARAWVDRLGRRLTAEQAIAYALTRLIDDAHEAALAEDADVWRDAVDRVLLAAPRDRDGYRHHGPARLTGCCAAPAVRGGNSGARCTVCGAATDPLLLRPALPMPPSVDLVLADVMRARIEGLPTRTPEAVASALHVTLTTARALLAGDDPVTVEVHHPQPAARARVAEHVTVESVDGTLTCQVCAEVLPVRAFPTVTGPLHRATECRGCRATRRAGRLAG